MTGFDIIVIVIVGVAAIGGFMRGLVQEVLSLATWFLAAFSMRFLHYPVYDFLLGYIPSSTLSAILAFALLLLIPYAGMKVIIGLAATDDGGSDLKPVDRVLGFGMGLVKGALIAVFGFCLIAFTFDDEWSVTGRPAWVATARTYPAINAATNELVPLIAARRAQLEEDEKPGGDTAQ